MKNLIIILIFVSNSLFGQAYKKYRESFSLETKQVLNRLDSLMCRDTLSKCEGQVESRTIGDGGTISKKYLQYAALVNAATEKELLVILDNSKETAAIRGYALMAYVYKCEKDGKKEKLFNYKFNLNMQVGCLGGTYTFPEFNRKIRVRRLYDPIPSYFVRDAIEQEVIRLENEIRKEQGEFPRKE